jgi:hypothetical protein
MAAMVIAPMGVMARPAAAEARDVVVGPNDNVQAALSAAAPGATKDRVVVGGIATECRLRYRAPHDRRRD